MATGERITVTYAKTPSGPLKLDLYAYVPKLDLADPSPTFSDDLRLPFFLYLHAGHFFTGSRRDLPPWLASLARSMGMPLVCADYRLAPHVGPSDAYRDLEACWSFIVDELNWVVAAAGNGAEVQSGTKMLEDDFEELQRRGGLDPQRCVLVGLGAGGYLAARG
ncbi:hypothetical protein FA10DRAFT_163528 [Acaromyces ingoldii]|uniref:Alpha/beta hydrolase fold-3 domain-containing protein n=1 Tax=Acaromyces ingoldii TaxID=215250 RepID=A0A316YL43_9BASI|nr:hypothetical protein FA10DRAFT_163528 [Acaromyces ingoldii]PWN88445.1 hypothetical protein FA10DRAFT_163528 [Acaromyces ingoldii]